MAKGKSVATMNLKPDRQPSPAASGSGKPDKFIGTNPTRTFSGLKITGKHVGPKGAPYCQE